MCRAQITLKNKLLDNSLNIIKVFRKSDQNEILTFFLRIKCYYLQERSHLIATQSYWLHEIMNDSWSSLGNKSERESLNRSPHFSRASLVPSRLSLMLRLYSSEPFIFILLLNTSAASECNEPIFFSWCSTTKRSWTKLFDSEWSKKLKLMCLSTYV